MRQKRPVDAAKEAYSRSCRGLFLKQKRPTICSKRGLHYAAKEAYTMRQKRPIYAAKETYLCGKRDLPMRQKRPFHA